MSAVPQLLESAVKLHQTGQLAQAERLYRQVLEIEPRQVDAWHLLGLLAHQGGRSDLALEYLAEALRLKPDFAEAHGSLGIVLKRQGRLEEAVASYRQALRFKPELAETHHNLAIALRRQGKLDEAVAAYHEAVRLKPDYAEALSNLGVALKEQGRLDEAAGCLERALRVKPGFAEAHNNLGGVLKRRGQFAEAAACFEQALRLRPDYAEAMTNLASALRDQGRIDEAVSTLGEALRVKPDYAEAHLNLGLISLLRGRFEEGWPKYEWRWKGRDLCLPPYRQPIWDGGPLLGRTILLYGEQGLGDTLQFVRYAPLVKERGGRVVVACSAALHGVLARSPGIDSLCTPESPPNFDVYAPLLSLPRILGTTLATVPAPVPYLFADEHLVQQWRGELSGTPGFKIGIVWQGNPQNPSDRFRSIPLAQFAPLSGLAGVRLFSLQKGPGSEQLAAAAAQHFPVTDLGRRLDEETGPFEDTAAVMQNLDLIVTADTSIAHLAGGLGVPVWIALSLVPDWRWMLQREDSPWYPTARLFRQTRWNGWDEVFERMAAELPGRIGKPGGTP